MRAKNVDRHLRKVFSEWVASIEDEELRGLVELNAFITGGCIVSLLLGEKVNDYDVYLKDLETAERLARYYVKEFRESSDVLQSGVALPITVEAVPGDKEKGTAARVKIVVKSAGIAAEGEEDDYHYFEQEDPEMAEDYVGRQFEKVSVIQRGEDEPPEDFIAEVVDKEEKILEKVDRESGEGKKKFRPVFITSNSITLSDKFQIVVRFIGSPKKIHENFDFVHVTNYWLPKDGLHLNKEALASIATKELKVINNGSKYPICTLFRLRKFLSRGWIITAGQLLKIALQISDLDLDDAEVLEEQLIGVDVAYFVELIDLLHGKKREKDIIGVQLLSEDEATDRIDRAYLIQIIDKLF